ncbi:cyclic nucleotide-binding domain-containing protein [Metabacillus sp. GX 13764]|uniref:Crp/Fnr family transcriptional regulator n=1 Tax=Metabacillus kandeliae TaxID=2900151 RepID=UPI001E6503C3|nr:cyclic nucleotide-binding domain-containing protein [Metabacillus kandeliae]MCD7035141.1 cyclic nucleotide-binding domain-containing protein [Metabacillus kandeliae]
MGKIFEAEMLESYMKAFQLDSIFNQKVQPYMKLAHFNRQEIICSQGGISEHLYVLVEGKVKVFTTSPEGKTLILSFKKPLELIGDIEFVRGTSTVNTVEAVSAVTMIGIPYRELRKYAGEDPAFLQFLLGIITDKFYIKSSTLQFNMLYPVEVRLASYLLSVSYDDETFLTGRHSSKNLRDAANLIGTSYRHMNRVIQQFCGDGLIERTKKGIIVKDREGLGLIANGNIYE